MSVASMAIGVRRVAGNIGAEISGVRVGPDLPEPVVRQVREALLEHKVVFFRGQHDLDDVAMAGFAKLFGELQPHRRKAVSEEPLGKFVHGLDSAKTRATVWHTDATLTVQPPDLTLLRAVELPPYGGDTAWANTAAAYQRMGPDWQALADGLRAIHTNNMAGRHMLRAEAARQEAEGTARTLPEAMADPRRAADFVPKKLYETEHPVVRVHPETNERCLLLGAFAKTILGRDDSDSLLNIFQAYITALDNTVRWQWELGDVAMWDNRATQHCGISNYGGHKRRLSRCTVAGTIPVGVDGRSSIAHASPE